MEYIRRVDFSALGGPTERGRQILLDKKTDSASVNIRCIQTPAGEGSPSGMHTHPNDQIFYVLSGTMDLEIAGKHSAAGPGSLVVFPAGIAHRNWNGGTEPTVHLAIDGPVTAPETPKT